MNSPFWKASNSMVKVNSISCLIIFLGINLLLASDYYVVAEMFSATT